MLFNSLEFALFLPLVWLLYWIPLKSNIKGQNILLFIASYIFYGWWDWRFLGLIAFSSCLDYILGLLLGKESNQTRRKLLLWTSILVNIGLLGVFKYYNFFIDSFSDAFTAFGYQFSVDRLSIVLPVGISFYTFQTLSYTIDVYKGKFKPTNDFVAFMAFVSFFPQLVAGPIERASHLLPQFKLRRLWNEENIRSGLKQILWGLFKKVVIADNCAHFANQIFGNVSEYSGSTLFLGAMFFAVQIYCDFSGYSEIAIGTARLFGFDLMKNFNNPYFAVNIADFWRRWHISLTTWFRDYVYIPLGGNRRGIVLTIVNTFIVFIVSGFWHGANYTFIFWGVLHSLLFVPILVGRFIRPGFMKEPVEIGGIPTFRQLTGILFTFILVSIGWILFRAENLNHAISIYSKIFSGSLIGLPEERPRNLFILIFLLFAVEWFQKNRSHALDFTGFKVNRLIRWSSYYIIVTIILFYGAPTQDFIYFQF